MKHVHVLNSVIFITRILKFCCFSVLIESYCFLLPCIYFSQMMMMMNFLVYRAILQHFLGLYVSLSLDSQYLVKH